MQTFLGCFVCSTDTENVLLCALSLSHDFILNYDTVKKNAYKNNLIEYFVYKLLEFPRK